MGNPYTIYGYNERKMLVHFLTVIVFTGLELCSLTKRKTSVIQREPSQPAPVVLRTHTQFEHPVQHPLSA